MTFKALVARESSSGAVVRSIEQRSFDDLPEGDVLIRVHYSSLNYKDGLSATGKRGITRLYPHTPGIDAAGMVDQSSSASFRPGDKVVVTGYELGSNADGGWAEFVRVPSDWIVPLPAGLSLRESMILGTAGFTAGLAVHRLLHHGVEPGQGPVVVTGATGGVGCLAVAILARRGFYVTAVTGKHDAHQFLRALGASDILTRDQCIDTTSRALLTRRWAGAVDTVGGPFLDTILRQINNEGAVACCGNIATPDLRTSIYPFILRGVALLGINSASTPMAIRKTIWQELSTGWKPSDLNALSRECRLEDLEPSINAILDGAITGRVLINLVDKAVA
jgi:putative YhdH/YhfP family quinone oxidoreductase